MSAGYCTMHNERCVENHTRLLALPHIRLRARLLPFTIDAEYGRCSNRLPNGLSLTISIRTVVSTCAQVSTLARIPMHRNWVRLPGGDSMGATCFTFISLFFSSSITATHHRFNYAHENLQLPIDWQSQKTFPSSPHQPSHIQLSVRIPAVRVPTI